MSKKIKIKKIKKWIKSHKVAFVGIVIGAVIVGLILFAVIGSFLAGRTMVSRRAYYYGSSKSLGLEAPGMPFVREKGWTTLETTGGRGEIEVREGSMEIKSKKAEDDFAEIRSIVENYQGYVEKSSKSITNLYVRINLTLRVPPRKLADLVDELKKKFEVRSYNIKNYRISIERELDEFQILEESLADYQEIRKEIKEMKVGKDKIDLLMKLTDKELELKRKERNYQREISSQKRRGEYATLQVAIKQKKSPKIWPENVLDQFKDRIRRALENVVDILKEMIGGGIELFFKAVQLAVYIFIIGIVAVGFYRVGKELFRRLIRFR